MARALPINPAKARELVASRRWLDKVQVDEASGCWRRAVGLNDSGYGSISFDGGRPKTHRVAYVAATGVDIPAGLEVDHLCHNADPDCREGDTCPHRVCVNPDHLEATTGQINRLRGKTIAADQAARTHCPRGHELAGDNLRPSDLARGFRGCLTCARARSLAQSRAITAAAHALGITRTAYVAAYGKRQIIAEEIVHEIEAARRRQPPQQLDLDLGLASGA